MLDAGCESGTGDWSGVDVVGPCLDRSGWGCVFLSDSTHIYVERWRMKGQAMLIADLRFISRLYTVYTGVSWLSIAAIRGLPSCSHDDQIIVGAVYHHFVISRLADVQAYSYNIGHHFT